MLTRLWSALTSGLKTEDLASLHVCQWQTHKKVLLLYLLWRWICAIVCLAIIVCSSIDIGREKSGEKFDNHYEKWWIYLTNWTVLCCVVQAWLAALICTKALMDNNRDFGKNSFFGWFFLELNHKSPSVYCRGCTTNKSWLHSTILLDHLLDCDSLQLHCVSYRFPERTTKSFISGHVLDDVIAKNYT
jgi:hypothetical protein